VGRVGWDSVKAADGENKGGRKRVLAENCRETSKTPYQQQDDFMTTVVYCIQTNRKGYLSSNALSVIGSQRV